MLRSAILVTALTAAPAWADVLVVDPVNGPFTTLTDAVAAASDGDTILVEPGVYAEPARVVIDDVDLTILGRGPASPVFVFPGLTVRDLAPDRVVTLQHLGLRGLDGAPGTPPTVALSLERCAGRVTVSHCSIVGARGAVDDGQVGSDGTVIDECSDVLFIDSYSNGGEGSWGIALTSSTAEGGHGIHASMSHAVLYESAAKGGDGGTAGVSGPEFGGQGGVGAWIDGGTLYFTNSITGGRGGHGTFQGGDGGAGLVVASGAEVTTNVTASTSGGVGGWADFGDTGAPGPDLVLAGTLNELGGPLRDFSITSPVREGKVGTMVCDGFAGDTVYVFASFAPQLQLVPNAKGVLTLAAPHVVPIGPLGPPGDVEVDFTVPELGPGVEALDVFVQPVFFLDDKVRLGVPGVVTLLDAAY